MDITEALRKWDELGHTTHSYTDENDRYTVDFIKEGEVKGHIKVYPGQGISWDYPDELMQGR